MLNDLTDFDLFTCCRLPHALGITNASPLSGVSVLAPTSSTSASAPPEPTLWPGDASISPTATAILTVSIKFCLKMYIQLGQLRLIPPGLGLLVLVVGYEVA